jgi:hypothetical protein
MPKPISAPPAAASAAPTVSVSEALGLPADWSLEKSLKGEEGVEPPVSAPAPASEEPAAGEEPAKEGAGGEPPAKPAEPVKPAAPAKPASSKTPAKVPPVKPEPKPTSPAKPAEPAAKIDEPAKPEVKIKIGGKEWTEKELEERIAKTANPDKPAETAPVAPKPKTPEELAAERAEVQKKDNEWVEKNLPTIGGPAVDEATMDKILAGGPDAVKEFNNIIRRQAAHAVLEMRKSLAVELNPVLEQIRADQQPLIDAHTEAQDNRAWDEFQEKNPDLADYRELVENAANVLVKDQAERVRKMTMDEFQEETAMLVRGAIKRFGGKAAAAAATAPAEPVAAPAKPAVPSKPAAPARAKVQPPPTNLPTPTPGKNTKGVKGDSAIIESLM